MIDRIIEELNLYPGHFYLANNDRNEWVAVISSGDVAVIGSGDTPQEAIDKISGALDENSKEVEVVYGEETEEELGD